MQRQKRRIIWVDFRPPPTLPHFLPSTWNNIIRIFIQGDIEKRNDIEKFSYSQRKKKNVFCKSVWNLFLDFNLFKWIKNEVLKRKKSIESVRNYIAIFFANILFKMHLFVYSREWKVSTILLNEIDIPFRVKFYI